MHKLEEKYVANCKLLADRYKLLPLIPKNGKGCEIGVLGGDWSQDLVENCQPSELQLIDTFRMNDYPNLKRFKKKNHLSYIQNKFKDHPEVIVNQGKSWDILKTYEDQYFDWIYVDAGHDLDSVTKDLNECLRVIKPGGWLIMNDYIMYDHFTKEKYGVVQATNKFMMENQYEMIYFALHPDMFCDVVIKKMD